jgi:hypothetical protein
VDDEPHLRLLSSHSNADIATQRANVTAAKQLGEQALIYASPHAPA